MVVSFQADYPTFTLPSLTDRQKQRLIKSAEQVLITQQQMLTKTGKNILHHALKRKRKFIRMQHYPQGDRIDFDTGGQYFYHCHRENEATEEHGHFHCFLRQPHIPSRIKPKSLHDWDKYQDNPMTHLVAIGMNRLGQPIRLFTVNRWVTEETWFDAKHVASFTKRFKMTLTDDPHWQVLDRWVEGMLQLFSPQIHWLHHARDSKMAHYSKAFPNDNLYENRAIEELSDIRIDLASQVQWIINA